MGGREVALSSCSSLIGKVMRYGRVDFISVCMGLGMRERVCRRVALHELVVLGTVFSNQHCPRCATICAALSWPDLNINGVENKVSTHSSRPKKERAT